MPVFKIKKDGAWQEVAGVSGHSHSVSQIVDFPHDLIETVNNLKAEVEALKSALALATVEETKDYLNVDT